MLKLLKSVCVCVFEHKKILHRLYSCWGIADTEFWVLAGREHKRDLSL